MTFNGTSSVANYQTLLRTIVYSSSSGDPSNGGLNTTRTATWVAMNGAFGSPPVITTIDVFIAGQPTWAMTGAAVALHPATDEAWVSGLGVGPLSSQITVTRSTQATCYTGQLPVAVTFAAPNTECATAQGLQIFQSYTNYLKYSNDVSNSNGWIVYTNGAAGSSVAIVGHSVLDPTNVTSQAAKVTVTRTSTGNFASVVNNTWSGPTGNYNMSVWLKADSPADVGKVIQFAFLSSSGYNVSNLTLTADWQLGRWRNVGNPVAGCNGGTQSCQFQVGLTNQPGSGGAANSTLTASFDVWGSEVTIGPAILYPPIGTANDPVTVQADNVKVTAGSALENALIGPASSVIMGTNLGVINTLASVINSNGTDLLSQNADNTLGTDISLILDTTNVGVWNGFVTQGLSRDGSGRSLAMNSLVVKKDSQPTVIGVPIYLGSMSGTSNFFNGYLQDINVFNTRVADSLLGVTGTGTNYYFATAGNDSNLCTISSPCQSIAKANTIGMVTNDTMNFNGGDTFTGCLNLFGGVNWNATRDAPATVRSYGTGQATLTPNCIDPNGQSRIGIINLISTDGVIIDNLHLVGDPAVANGSSIGIWLRNCDSTKAHGNITIENNTLTGIHTGPSNAYGAALFLQDGSCNNGAFQSDHISVLNNTDAGASPTATDNQFIGGYGYKCSQQYDIIQGNLVYNLGGLVTSFAGAEGNGMVISACGLGSANNSQSPNGLTGAISQFNIVHDNAANMHGCGGAYGIWTAEADAVIIRLNEVYHMMPLISPTSCDYGAFDFDAGGGNFATNSIAERNYSHGNYGPCAALYFGSNNTYRWNICDGDGVGDGTGNHNQAPFSQSGSTLGFVYNNVFVKYAGIAGETGAVIQYNGCPATGSLFANNIVIARYVPTSEFYFTSGGNNTTNICSSPPPVGGLTITHNDWWSDKTSSTTQYRAEIDAQAASGTITGAISGTTLTSSATTGTIKQGMLITGTGIPASTYITVCSPCSGATTMTVSRSLTIGSESIAAVGGYINGTFAQMESLINETGGLKIDPLFVTPYAQTTCGNLTGGPQANSPSCPAGMKLQSGSSMHAPAGAVLTSAPFNLPANNGGTTGNPTHGQGTLDYWGTTLPCPTTGGFPIGAQC